MKVQVVTYPPPFAVHTKVGGVAQNWGTLLPKSISVLTGQRESWLEFGDVVGWCREVPCFWVAPWRLNRLTYYRENLYWKPGSKTRKAATAAELNTHALRQADVFVVQTPGHYNGHKPNQHGTQSCEEPVVVKFRVPLYWSGEHVSKGGGR